MEPEQKCAGCGSCTVVCPVYRATGNETLTARGKQRLLESELSGNPSSVFKDIFAKCLLCGACESVCPRKLPIIKSVVGARSRFQGFYGRHGFRKKLVTKIFGSSSVLASLARLGFILEKKASLPSWSGLRLKLSIFDDLGEHLNPSLVEQQSPVMPAQDSILLFSGCFARFIQPSIVSSINELILYQNKKSTVVPVDQKCCGLAAYSMGELSGARKLAMENIDSFKESEATILVPCASCYFQLKRYPELLADDKRWYERALVFSKRLHTFEDFFVQLARSGVFRASKHCSVIQHSSCHQRFSGHFSSSPEELYSLIDNISYLGELNQCCGFGGLFQMGYPEISQSIFQCVYKKIGAYKHPLVLTSCSGCLIQWNQELLRFNSSISCQHPAQFLASCLRRIEYNKKNNDY
ncbi:MAG: (Fe-S)-binding protein [Desulfobulbaceae bacterium]|nr:(Fe-S)-binding protein [Desulfobulbaceae bacterium]